MNRRSLFAAFASLPFAAKITADSPTDDGENLPKDEPHVHTPGDGRGMRRVFLDGKRVEYVFYADTREGVVRFYLENDLGRPYLAGGAVAWAEKRGRVVVTPYT